MLLAEPVAIATGRASVRGELRVPPAPAGLVICIQGGGSLTAQDAQLPDVLLGEGFAALLVHLLPETGDLSLGRDLDDIDDSGHRVSAVVDWCAARSPVSALPIGLCGAGTGAAAALVAAAQRPASIVAVVSRAGRPDRAAAVLPRVLAPTLLLVGAGDGDVLEANEAVMGEFGGIVQLEVVTGATDAQAFGREAAAVVGWYRRHLASPGASAAVIPAREWSAFLEGFSGRHCGCLVDVTADATGRRAAEVAAARPLESIRTIVDRGHVAAIEVRFADCRPPLAVSAIRPAVVRAYETPRGAECALEIEDRYGVRTRVRLGPSRMLQEAGWGGFSRRGVRASGGGR